MTTYTDTVLIGGGQAGLSVSYYLTQESREHLLRQVRPGAIIAWTPSAPGTGLFLISRPRTLRLNVNPCGLKFFCSASPLFSRLTHKARKTRELKGPPGRSASMAFTVLLSVLVALPSFAIGMSLRALTATAAALQAAPAQASPMMSLFTRHESIMSS